MTKITRRKFLGGALKTAIAVPLTAWFARQPGVEAAAEEDATEDVDGGYEVWDTPYYPCSYPALQCSECPSKMCAFKCDE